MLVIADSFREISEKNKQLFLVMTEEIDAEAGRIFVFDGEVYHDVAKESFFTWDSPGRRR